VTHQDPSVGEILKTELMPFNARLLEVIVLLGQILEELKEKKK
jgi:hypothetical protein